MPDHGPGIELAHHAVQGHPEDEVTGKHPPGDGGRAAVPGQERAVEVEAAPGWTGEEALREDEADVGGDSVIVMVAGVLRQPRRRAWGESVVREHPDTAERDRGGVQTQRAYRAAVAWL